MSESEAAIFYIEMGEEEGFLPFFKSFETMCLHCYQNPAQWNCKSLVPHIVPSTVFKIDDSKGYTYSRAGNPNRSILQNILSAINRAKYSLCFSSGMSALIAVLTLLKTGQHIICCNEVSEETYKVFDKVARNYEICTTFTSFKELSNICEAITDNTKLIWAENPSDATLNVVDLCQLARLAKENKILLGVNNTYLTPYLQRPLDFGADIVMQSLTKYMNGHSDIIMGNLSINDAKLHDALYRSQVMVGMVPSPFDCYEVIRGLKTLNLRMDQHLRNSLTIAKYMAKHPVVQKVIHPGLPDHPQHDIFRSQASGHSGIIAFYLNGSLDKSKKFVNSLKLFSVTEIAGGCESTIQIPHIMSHKHLSNQQKTLLNITENLIKMSIGLEGKCDLILDIEQALDQLKKC